IYDTYSFQVIPKLGQVVAGDAASYQYLVESIRKFPPQPVFAGMIKDAGFTLVGKGWEDLTFGVAAIHTGSEKESAAATPRRDTSSGQQRTLGKGSEFGLDVGSLLGSLEADCSVASVASPAGSVSGEARGSVGGAPKPRMLSYSAVVAGAGGGGGVGGPIVGGTSSFTPVVVPHHASTDIDTLSVYSNSSAYSAPHPTHTTKKHHHHHHHHHAKPRSAPSSVATNTSFDTLVDASKMPHVNQQQQRKLPRDVSLRVKPTGQLRFRDDAADKCDFEAITGIFEFDSFDTPTVTYPMALPPDLEARLNLEIAETCQKLLPGPDDVVKRKKFVLKIQTLINNEWPDKNITVHAFGNLSCDVNVNNILALRNTELMKAYVDLDDRVRPFVTIIKYWAKQRALNDAAKGGTLSSYCWVIMCINFLQTRTPPILPSLQQIYLDKLASASTPPSPSSPSPSTTITTPPAAIETTIIEGVDCSFEHDIAPYTIRAKLNTSSLAALVYGFFRHFACEFSYPTQIVSVRHGTLLSKRSKGWDVDVDRMCRYLCVEEPLTPDRNLANSADAVAVAGLRGEMRRALEGLLGSGGG
ncbi:hypothetical protein HDU98_004114, partial [Podochytrium sp. JEL0797]